MTTAVASVSLLRRSALFLVLLVPLIAVGFWPSYFTRAVDEPQWRIHVHGFLMFGWVSLLLAQAFLVRRGQRQVHRALGRVSFVLAPLVVVSSLALAHWRLNHPDPGTMDALVYFLYVQLALLVQFATAWTLAMSHRGEPLVHARYMLCTALALVDPIVARIGFNLFGVDIPWSQVVTYGLVDAILVALVLWERRHATGSKVFAGMLVLFVLTQAPTFFLSQTPAWQAFARWFASLGVV